MGKIKPLWIAYALTAIAFLCIILNGIIPSMPDLIMRVSGVVSIICLIIIGYQTSKKKK